MDGDMVTSLRGVDDRVFAQTRKSVRGAFVRLGGTKQKVPKPCRNRTKTSERRAPALAARSAARCDYFLRAVGAAVRSPCMPTTRKFGRDVAALGAATPTVPLSGKRSTLGLPCTKSSIERMTCSNAGSSGSGEGLELS